MNKIDATHKVVLTAVFVALGVISTLLFKMIPMGPLPFLRFSLTPALTVFSSLAIGPFYGMVVGVLSDLVPSLVLPVGGAPNFFLWVVYGLLGILPHFFMKATFKFRKTLANPYSIGVILLLFFGVLCLLSYLDPTLSGAYGDLAYVLRPLFLALAFVLEVGLLVALILLKKKREKEGPQGSLDSDPYALAFVVVLSESLLMVLGKSSAFYLFYLLLGQGYSPSYWYFLATLSLGFPLSATIDFYFLSFLYSVFHRVRRSKKDTW